MNCNKLIELLENENDVVNYYLNEIFYDDDVEIDVDEFYNDEIQIDDEFDNKFEYLIKNYSYDYELIIEIQIDDDVDELKKHIENVDDEIHIVDEEHFKVNVRVSLSPNFFGWLFSFGGKIELTFPPAAVERYKEMIESVLNNF